MSTETEFYPHYRDYPSGDLYDDGSFREWSNFSPREIACRGTGALLIHRPSMDKLQALRERIGRPLIVNSAYRSPSHNAAVGGAKASQHLLGRAFDISMSNQIPDGFEDEAVYLGFNGIGHYAPKNGAYNFMHIDTRLTPTSWCGGGGWFPSNTGRFTPEPTISRPADAAKDVAIGAGGTLALESVLREISIYLPEPWGYRAMAFAIFIPFGIGLASAALRFWKKYSAEPEIAESGEEK